MGLSQSAISRVVGVEMTYKSFSKNGAQLLPQRLAVFGQANEGVSYPNEKYEGEGSAAAVANRFGWGSPLHLAALQLYPENGTGASFPVDFIPVEAGAGANAAVGGITITGDATANGSGKIYIGGKKCEFSVSKGDTAAAIMDNIAAAINSVLEMPATATAAKEDNVTKSITLTAKWKGGSGNDIKVFGEANLTGPTITFTAFSGGNIDPSTTLSSAFTKMGGVWYTCLLNTWNYDNTDILDLFKAEGERRWGVMVKQPCFSIVGCTDNYATRTSVTDVRKDDYINALGVSVGSPELPLSIAARYAFFALETFDKNPAQDVKDTLTGLLAGSEEEQEEYTVRNNAQNKGSSTNVRLAGKNGCAVMNDFITMYHPDTEGKYPSKKYVVDIVKLQNICYNVRLIMEQDDLKGAPLVADGDVVTNPKAVQPKVIVGYFYNLADSLVKNAIITDAAYTKKNMTVAIDDENPKRLNTTFPVKLSGNIEVSSNDIYFAFNTGSAA